ncbi:MAG: hypothetical protein QM667_09570 [Asticcacaulis sp.]
MFSELRVSLDLIQAVMPEGAPWWIIGSTALYLSGVDLRPRDVDVFGPSDVIEAARLRLGADAMPPRPDASFRSSPYFQYWPEGGLEIDFMGDLQVMSGGEWCELRIASEMWAGGLRLPTLEEQAAILRLFGRPKDMARLALIEGVKSASR